jgi:hypothetical protein
MNKKGFSLGAKQCGTPLESWDHVLCELDGTDEIVMLGSYVCPEYGSHEWYDRKTHDEVDLDIVSWQVVYKEVK